MILRRTSLVIAVKDSLYYEKRVLLLLQKTLFKGNSPFLEFLDDFLVLELDTLSTGAMEDMHGGFHLINLRCHQSLFTRILIILVEHIIWFS
jgi:hypothetical protein